MEVFVPLARTKEDGKRKFLIGRGWAWAKVREGGDNLGYRRGRGQNRELASGFTFWMYIRLLTWLL